MSVESADEMPVWMHLSELRSRLVRLCLVLAVGTIITFQFSEPLVRFLEAPLLEILPAGEAKLYFTGIADKFFVYLKVSLICTIGVLFPYVLWEVWRFVEPALHAEEKRVTVPFLISGTLCFLLGLAFAYYIVIPYSYDFLIHFGSDQDQAIITLTEYFSLTTKLLLGLGLIFEIPVISLLLAFLGILDADTLVRSRKGAILVIGVASAAITPTPDAMTMLIVMVPMWLWYELSIVGVRWVNRRQAAD